MLMGNEPAVAACAELTVRVIFPPAVMPALKPDSGRLTDSDNADSVTDRIAELALPSC
jgi:hypothetical protein